MAPKKLTGQVKLQIPAGKATPAPPVGPALGQAGINIMEFCKQFNAKTSAKDLGTPNKDKVGKVTEKQVSEIAKQKLPDLNAASLETAIKSVKGTARSM